MKNIVIIIIVLVVVGAGGYILLNKNKQMTPATNQTPIVSKEMQNASAMPSASAKPSISAAMSPSGTMSAKETTVNLTANGFEPATVTIKAGETVVWVNKSGDTATVNSNNHPTHLLYPPLNLGQFANGGKLQLTFDKPGSYGYHNHLDPSKKGIVVVQ